MSRPWWRANRRILALVGASGILLAAPAPTSLVAQAEWVPTPLSPLGYSQALYDTLVAIVGHPRAVRVDITMPSRFLARYDARRDVIELNPRVFWSERQRPAAAVTNTAIRLSPDWVISHEFGHRYDFTRGLTPSHKWLRYTFALRAGCWYANSDAFERWAEAFANAVDFLRYMASAPIDHAPQTLAHREWFVPGTTFVVGLLLATPLYSRHPLNAPTP